MGNWYAATPVTRVAKPGSSRQFGFVRAVSGSAAAQVSTTVLPLFRPPWNVNQAGAAAEDSLRRLGTDYIDVYLVHKVDTLTPLDKTIELQRHGLH